jgi:hypothetical protein
VILRIHEDNGAIPHVSDGNAGKELNLQFSNNLGKVYNEGSFKWDK